MALFKSKEVEMHLGEQEDLERGAMRTVGWMPGVSASASGFQEGALRGYISPAHTPKQRKVLSLLRECWDIEVTEVTGALGEIELHLDQLKFDLLRS